MYIFTILRLIYKIITLNPFDILLFIFKHINNLLRFIKHKIEVIIFDLFEKFIFYFRVVLTYTFIFVFINSLIFYFLPKNIIFNFWQQKHFLLFVFVLSCLLIVEITIFKLNKNKTSSDKTFIVPISSRLFALIGYTWFFLELSRMYDNENFHVLEKLGGEHIKFVLLFLNSWYDVIPESIREGLLFLFYYIFHFGVVRNKEHFYYFTRYHYSQALLFGACSIFINHVLLFFINNFSMTLLGMENLSIFLYSLFCLLIIVSLFYIFIGKETKFILFHDGIRCQVGPKIQKSIK